MRLAKTGILGAVSVGFRPIEWTPTRGGGQTFTAWELLELSLCPIPCDPDALVIARSMQGRVLNARDSAALAGLERCLGKSTEAHEAACQLLEKADKHRECRIAPLPYSTRANIPPMMENDSNSNSLHTPPNHDQIQQVPTHHPPSPASDPTNHSLKFSPLHLFAIFPLESPRDAVALTCEPTPTKSTFRVLLTPKRVNVGHEALMLGWQTNLLPKTSR